MLNNILLERKKNYNIKVTKDLKTYKSKKFEIISI